MKRIKNFFGEFKKFISRGNVIDLAVGVIIGSAFTKIVTSLVNDIVMPLITAMLGANSLSDLSIPLKYTYDEILGKNVVSLSWNYGNFIQTIIDFLIIAFFVFLVIKLFNKASNLTKELNKKIKTLTKRQIKKLKKQGLSDEEIEKVQEKTVAETTPPPAPKPTSEQLLTEILEVLKSKNNDTQAEKTQQVLNEQLEDKKQ